MLLAAFSVSAMGVSKKWSVNLPWIRSGVQVQSGYIGDDTSGQVKLSKMGGAYNGVWIQFRIWDGSQYVKATTDGRLVYNGQTVTMPLMQPYDEGTYIVLYVGNNKWALENMYAEGTVRFP